MPGVPLCLLPSTLRVLAAKVPASTSSTALQTPRLHVSESGSGARMKCRGYARLRRSPRLRPFPCPRAALTRDRPAHGSVDADMPDAQPAGQQPPGQLESRSGEVEEPPAAAAAAAGAGSERTLPKSPLASPAFASPAFALF
jgi:hypothetical protein